MSWTKRADWRKDSTLDRRLRPGHDLLKLETGPPDQFIGFNLGMAPFPGAMPSLYIGPNDFLFKGNKIGNDHGRTGQKIPGKGMGGLAMEGGREKKESPAEANPTTGTPPG